MSRRYLNKESREFVSLTFRFVDVLEKQEEYILKAKQQHKEDKEKLKYLRTAITYVKKYLGVWTENVDNAELQRILKLFETTGLLLKDNYQARLQLKRWENDISDRKIEVHQELFEDLLDIAIKKECIGCKRSDVQECKLRRIMLKYDAPPVNEDPVNCQFSC